MSSDMTFTCDNFSIDLFWISHHFVYDAITQIPSRPVFETLCLVDYWFDEGGILLSMYSRNDS
jgi:hypothetical protein